MTVVRFRCNLLKLVYALRLSGDLEQILKEAHDASLITVRSDAGAIIRYGGARHDSAQHKKSYKLPELKDRSLKSSSDVDSWVLLVYGLADIKDALRVSHSLHSLTHLQYSTLANSRLYIVNPRFGGMEYDVQDKNDDRLLGRRCFRTDRHGQLVETF